MLQKVLAGSATVMQADSGEILVEVDGRRLEGKEAECPGCVEKESELDDMEANLMQALSSIKTFHVQQKELFDEFVALREKYDKLKGKLRKVLWDYVPSREPDEFGNIPSCRAFRDGNLVEEEDRIGHWRLGALLGHAIGHGAGGPIFDDRPRALQRRHGRQRHAQHGGGGAEIIVRRPFDQPAQRFGQGRGVHHLQQVAQAIVADAFDVGKAILLPHDADDLPWPQRRDDDAAMLHPHPVRHAIVERAEGGVEQEDTSARRHGLSLAAGAAHANRRLVRSAS